MNIFYIITALLVLIMQILIKKNDEKESLIKWITFSMLIFMAYNIVIVVVMSFFNIKSTLINLSIINIITSVILGFKIYSDKKIQKYNLEKREILAIMLFAIFAILIGIKIYGIPFEIKYKVSDASTHCLAARLFAENMQLLFKLNVDGIYMLGLQFLAPGAYINNGILMNIFSGITSNTYLYIYYIIFDLFNLYLSGMLMYNLLNRNKNVNPIIPYVLSIIYMISYPLSSIISGFAYLTLGLNFIIGILIVFKEKINEYYKMLLLFLLDFAIIFTYYYFAPIIYLAVFVQIIAEIISKKEKLFCSKNILKVLTTLILPGIFAIVYYFILQYFQNKNNIFSMYSSVISTPGPIYKNIITNIIPFLIFCIIYIINSFKERKIISENIMSLITAIVIVALFIGNHFGVVSEYYNYKVYYLLWMCIVCMAYNGFTLILSKNKIWKNILYGLLRNILSRSCNFFYLE